MQPTPVRPAAAGVVLDQDFAADAIARMRAMGAQNVDPPLPRSAYLKNIKTGVILPWSIGLAEQRDIMVNCDSEGNTDPSAWTNTVMPDNYNPDEQTTLYNAARLSMAGYTQHEIPQARMPEPNASVELPHGAQHMEEFFAERNQELLGIMDAAL